MGENEKQRKEGPDMSSSVQLPLLGLQTELWKARAQAKQKWLEQSLAQPTTSPDEAAWRRTWIKRALKVVKRGQAEVRHHAALMDVYAQHLNVLEMTLLAAGEVKRTTSAEEKQKRTPETQPV
jgi:hypothetical protein